MLAAKGKKVLLIDLDAQANLTSYLLGYEFEADNVFQFCKHSHRSEGEPTNAKKNLDIIPATLDLSVCEVQLQAKVLREQILKGALADFSDNLRLYPYRLSSSSWRDDRKCDCGCRLCRYSHNRWTFRSERCSPSMTSLTSWSLRTISSTILLSFSPVSEEDRSINLSPCHQRWLQGWCVQDHREGDSGHPSTFRHRTWPLNPFRTLTLLKRIGLT